MPATKTHVSDRDQRIADLERRGERLDSMMRSPLVLAGGLVEVLRDQAMTNPQMIHAAKLAVVLYGMIGKEAQS